MGLSFYYEFMAPATTTARELETFLQGVEQFAQTLGFAPTLVLNVPFDTPERRAFARHLGGSYIVQDEALKGVTMRPDQVRDHDPVLGECRLIPTHGVVLVMTDERNCESCFGFFQFPGAISDCHGAVLAATGLQGRWWYRDFVDSPDPRYRAIVKRFAMAGYLESEKDEFA